MSEAINKFLPFLKAADFAYKRLMLCNGYGFQPKYLYFNPFSFDYQPGTIPDHFNNYIEIFLTTKIATGIFLFTETLAFNNVAPPSRTLVEDNVSFSYCEPNLAQFPVATPSRCWGESPVNDWHVVGSIDWARKMDDVTRTTAALLVDKYGVNLYEKEAQSDPTEKPDDNQKVEGLVDIRNRIASYKYDDSIYEVGTKTKPENESYEQNDGTISVAIERIPVENLEPPSITEIETKDDNQEND